MKSEIDGLKGIVVSKLPEIMQAYSLQKQIEHNDPQSMLAHFAIPPLLMNFDLVFFFLNSLYNQVS